MAQRSTDPARPTRKDEEEIQAKYRDSDVSFACQGVAEIVPRPSPRAAQVKNNDMDLCPARLSLGVRGGGAKIGHGNTGARGQSQIRDTGFYQPYHDLLREYRLTRGIECDAEDTVGGS